ncbi:MAG: biotin--[acetyl-CoA-carboxylase] ligase [Deltaproteobacteria bacterium]|nr:biotin--[acetyl-CoA-carboxylase] ligase [Deltaproteobacteria bacterium]
MYPSIDRGFPDKLSSGAVQKGLTTEWLGQQPIFCFGVVETTNIEANRLAREGRPEGTLVVADAQTKGRGRLRRSWVSPPGTGLYLSVVLRPTCAPDRFPALTLTAGVATAAAIQQMGLVPQLKWPNDILISGKKVGGILTEAVFDKKQIDFAILGIGINVNTAAEEFPVSFRNQATSLRLSLGKPVSRVALLQNLLIKFEHYYGLFSEGDFGSIIHSWSELDSTLGREVEVSLPESRLLGVAEAVEPDGTLLVRDKTNRLHRIVAGDVVHCRTAPLTVDR